MAFGSRGTTVCSAQQALFEVTLADLSFYNTSPITNNIRELK